MSNTLVRARFVGPTNNKGSRVSIRTNTARTLIPVNYGWATDNVVKEGIAEFFGISTDDVQYRMDYNGWQFYIVNVRES